MPPVRGSRKTQLFAHELNHDILQCHSVSVLHFYKYEGCIDSRELFSLCHICCGIGDNRTIIGLVNLFQETSCDELCCQVC